MSLFAVDKGFGYAEPQLNGPTLREINPTTYAVSTMIGTPGQYAAAPGVGKAARVNSPTAFAYDPVSKRLIVADESSLFHVR